MEERSRWTMHWDEVSVFDGNAVSLGVEEIDLIVGAICNNQGKTICISYLCLIGYLDYVFREDIRINS